MILLLWIGCASEPCSPYFYENFGEGFLIQNCQGCHAREAVNRAGAPLEVSFDTYDDVMTHKEAILREIEESTMPPMGGLAADEREAALTWLTCATPEED